MKKSKALLFLVLMFLASCQSSPGAWMFERAVELWEEKKYEESVQNFVALITAYPDDRLADDSMFWVGNIYEHYLMNQDQAIRYYRLLNKTQKDSEYNVQAMMGLARIYANQDQEGHKKALDIRRKLNEMDLEEEEKDLNLLEIAKLFLELKQFEKTRISAKQLITTTKNPNYKAKGFHLIGQSFERESELELAELTYLEAEQQFNFGRESVPCAISLAEVYEKMDRLEQAIEVYRTIQNRLNPKEVLNQLAGDRIHKLELRKKNTQKG